MKKKFIRIFIIIIAVLLMAGGVIFLYERSKVAYGCLGMTDRWYEINLGENGRGFVQARFMDWDAIDTF